MYVRSAKPKDIDKMAAIADATLFPAHLLVDMINPFLNSDPDSLWLVSETNGTVSGFAFAHADLATDRTWALKALAVTPSLHRSGIGRAIATAAEETLREYDARMVSVDTGTGDAPEAAYHFYESLGYDQTASVPGYWADGADKIIFTKVLQVT